MKSIFKTLFIAVCLKGCLSFPADQITDLPGLNKSDATFKQYSGYLDIASDRHFHYWFVESESNPAKDPVILWLNGGPGASSLIGFWTENGPFRVKSDRKTLVKDPNSWNNLANVLYLESPANVGYSYSTNHSITYDDEQTAHDNYLALEKFFVKYPQFKNNSFYITGESYGGVYIPTLALKIYQHKSKINLKGVAIGNGLLDIDLRFSSSIKMAYSHNLIDSNEYNEYNNIIHNSANETTESKFNVFVKLATQIIENGINHYNIYYDCQTSPLNSSNSPYFKAPNFEINSEQIENYLGESIPLPGCEGDYFLDYIRDPKVRKALHIPAFLNDWQWIALNVTSIYKRGFVSMKPYVKELIEKHKIPKFIVYNGDVDMACDFIGNQQFVDELGFKLIQKNKKWTVGGRTAGFVKRYEEGLSFITVRNAGHFVPSDQPEAGLAIIKELIGLSKVA